MAGTIAIPPLPSCLECRVPFGDEQGLRSTLPTAGLSAGLNGAGSFPAPWLPLAAIPLPLRSSWLLALLFG